jgi:nucleotide-binding universal stress UspA family protein
MKRSIAVKVNNILWATDFSKESKACLPYIKYFSDHLKVTNHVIHVLPKFSDWIYETTFSEDIELFKTVEKTKKKSISKIQNYSKKSQIPFKIEVLEGKASEELIEYSKKNKIDMIFAGRRGISEIEEIIVGSTTSRLIRSSSIPVFVVPKPKRGVKIKNILSPIDLRESSMTELRYSIALAKQLGATVTVVHISEFFNYKVPVFIRDKLISKINDKIDKIAKETKYEIKQKIYEIGDPAKKIIEISKRISTDLIILATHQRKGIEKFFLGSISEKVLTHSNIPVLILPPSNYELS